MNKLTIRSPIDNRSFSSPVIFEVCPDCGGSNWRIKVTSTYALQDTQGAQASFQINTISVPTTYTLPLYELSPVLGGIGAYPTGGNPGVQVPSTGNVRPMVVTMSQINANGTSVPVPLSGLAPVADLGNVVLGTSKLVTNTPVSVTGASWYWYIGLFLFLIIAGGALLWIVTRKKKEVIPITEDPLLLRLL